MRSITRWAVLVGALGLALGSAPAAGIPLAATAATPSIGFEVPRVADPIHTYGEPDLGLEPNQPLPVTQPSDATTGFVYVSGPTGTGTQRSVWQGSVDGGHTFRNIHRNPTPLPGCDVITALCGPLAAPGGGDTEINFDHNNKQYYADLYALACQHTATRVRNADGTDTVAENATGGCPVPGSDRQWILVADPNLQTGPFGTTSAVSSTPPLVYMEANDLNCGAQWYKTTDGINYSTAELDGPGTLTNYCPFGADGYPTIDQPVSGARGRPTHVFEANFGSVTVGGQAKDAIQVNIGTPNDAAGDLCFLDAPSTSTACPSGTGLITAAVNGTGNEVVNNAGDAANFVVSSIDSARNLWVAWVDKSTVPSQRQAWVAVSSAASGWRTWSKPTRVSLPGHGSNVSIFPWIQAGSGGRADVAWYGDSTVADPSDTAASHIWNLYLAQVVFPNDPVSGVTTTATPTVDEVKVSPHPMDLTDVCLAGTACIGQFGNRNLADYFQLRTDKTGAAMIVYNDMSNGQCSLPPCPLVQSSDHAGAPLLTIARQSSGPGIHVTSGAQPDLVTGPSNAPVTGLKDAAGDALFPLFGGKNVPEMDLLSNSIAIAGQTMVITTTVAADPRVWTNSLIATNCLSASCNTQYVTRWQMGTNIYYGIYESGGPTPGFYSGKTGTIDDCSVSACDPHVQVYPETNAGTGSVECPPAPSAASPCTIRQTIDISTIGNPNNQSLLEEVGSYSFISTAPQSALNQTTERADNGATEIDGVCCYNFQVAGVIAPPAVTTPFTPVTNPSLLPNTAGTIGANAVTLAPALLGMVGLLGGAVAVIAAVTGRRRRRRAGP
ncbi:MAG: hypothetical protein ABR598_04490 [Candidatus Dormibacteria bacterium]